MNKHLKSLMDEGRAKKAFEINGLNFYEFTDQGFNISQQRFEAFQDLLATFNTFNVKKDDLDLFLTMTKDWANDATKKLSDQDSVIEALDNIKMLVTEMQQRIEYNLPIDRTYALATFLYVQEDENPIEYNEELNEKKKQLFKDNPDLFSFFLNRQLPIFLDLQRVFQPSFQTIIQEVNLKKLILLQIYTKSLSMDGKNNDTLSSINKQTADLKLYNNLIENLSQITTDSLNKD